MQTLQELVQNFQLYGVCESCARVAELNIETLMEQNGADYRIDQLRLRLTCSQCNQRSQSLRIVYVGEGRKSAAFRYRR